MRNFLNGYVNELCNNYEAMGQVSLSTYFFIFSIQLLAIVNFLDISCKSNWAWETFELDLIFFETPLTYYLDHLYPQILICINFICVLIYLFVFFLTGWSNTQRKGFSCLLKTNSYLILAMEGSCGSTTTMGRNERGSFARHVRCI